MLAFVFLFSSSPTSAGEARARADYMVHCQGCHVQDGSGFPGKVPDLRATLPLLISVEGGRAFLVRVPGSSQSALSDAGLAGVLNWMITNLTEGEEITGFTPYQPEEVTRYRATRLDDVFATRDALIGHLEGTDGRTTE
ncbi:MAG: cytochrome C [Rhodobiaceae bacterium]|nr:MAG: cytochrome C [Rhodobiaceae bacterium]